MKLYSAPISPFAARVRTALYAKNIPCEVLPPPAAGLKCAEFLALNPMGKIPVLVLDDGTCIPESETILEYLEDAYPAVSLRPEDPKERALMRTLIRVTENYVSTPMFRLFAHLNPATRDDAVVAAETARVKQGLEYLERYVADARYACGNCLTLADCCLFPSLYLCEIIAQQLGTGNALQSTPRLAGYFAKAHGVTVLKRVYDEIAEALAKH